MFAQFVLLVEVINEPQNIFKLMHNNFTQTGVSELIKR